MHFFEVHFLPLQISARSFSKLFPHPFTLSKFRTSSARRRISGLTVKPPNPNAIIRMSGGGEAPAPKASMLMSEPQKGSMLMSDPLPPPMASPPGIDLDAVAAMMQSQNRGKSSVNFIEPELR